MVKVAAAVMLMGLMNVMLMSIVGVAATGSNFKCPKAFFTFGDSLSDTGNAQTSFPSASRLYPPYGMSYTFRDKSGFNRYSDGRLIVDFVAQAFDHPFYGTYAHPLNGANYFRGANFAYSGATANATAFITPFHLNLQMDDFLNFKTKALESGIYIPDPKGLYQPLSNAFAEGAYYIPEIGGNDFFVASSVVGLPSPVVSAVFVPAAAAAVKRAITTLHDSAGARLFFVGNTPPQGCNPAQLTQFSNRPKDSLNCVDDINKINRDYSAALQLVLDQLRTSFSSDGTKIYYMDNYNASIEIFSNPGTYGFTNTQQACCGSGGPYNYGSAGNCSIGSCCPGQSACATPGSYVSWDGIHYTQAFYRQIAKFFLTGRFLSPALNLKTECHLDFGDFERSGDF